MNSPSSRRCPRIAVTPGDPAGIGPDILIAIAQNPLPAQIIAVADPQLLVDRAQLLGMPISIKTFDPAAEAQPADAGELFVDPVPLIEASTPGVGNAANSAYVLASLDRAIDYCGKGIFSALVTGPINKHLINQYLATQTLHTFFSGHTEYLAAQTNTDRVVMMLASNANKREKPMRVALATTHLPLRDVADAIQPAMLEQTLQILHQDLVDKFAIARPRILVCGLNPHAGEGGDLGSEEQTIIQPTIEKLRQQGLDLSDPLPADTLFTERHLQQADAVLAMYHDQGLPALKSHSFGEAINITLGLPFIRTSVDHGTAFDLAGSGKASGSSLSAAIDMAIALSQAQTA